jgi:hypothetical protein
MSQMPQRPPSSSTHGDGEPEANRYPPRVVAEAATWRR